MLKKAKNKVFKFKDFCLNPQTIVSQLFKFVCLLIIYVAVEKADKS